MSAPTPAPGDDRPREGYYPDPSIPGYVRYWNGAAWVPGTSRPAPSDGEPLPAPAGAASAQAPAPAAAEPAPAEETGPVFLDEEPSVRTERGPETTASPQVPAPGPVAQEPASAWQADAARQAGFGGEQDRRVSWGSKEPAEEPPAAPQAPTPTPTPAPADGTVAIRAVRPGPEQRPPRTDGTMTIRAVPQQAPASEPTDPQGPRSAPADPRVGAQAAPPAAPTPAPAPAPAPAPQPPVTPQGPGYGYPQPQQPQQPQSGYGYPQQAAPGPVTQGPGGGSPSWAQQVHHLATPGQEAEGAPVTPFKPVAEDPFLAAAQAAAAARPAGLGKRFVARLIDSLVVGAVTAVAAVPLGTKALDHVNGKIDEAKASGRQVTVWLLDGTTGTYLGIVLAVLLVAGVLYEALPTAKWGRTLGKKLMGLSVREIEGNDSPSFGAALRRWLVYSVPGLLAIGVLGVLWGAFDRPWRQCLHDKAAGTFVAG
ncbi:RDD family protein [Streptomyces sp. NPDC059524]|uniref:RDD family protein n=1 Tax=Streptomyces sp. NPDC059524 TaxID=3346856 RepID=UPI00368D2280